NVCQRISEIVLKRPRVKSSNDQGYGGGDGTIAKPLAIEQLNSQPHQREDSKRPNHCGERSQDGRVHPVFPAQHEERAEKQCHEKRLCPSQQRSLEPLKAQQREESGNPTVTKPVAER